MNVKRIVLLIFAPESLLSASSSRLVRRNSAQHRFQFPPSRALPDRSRRERNDLLICPTGVAEKVSIEREYQGKELRMRGRIRPVAQADRRPSGRYRDS